MKYELTTVQREHLDKVKMSVTARSHRWLDPDKRPYSAEIGKLIIPERGVFTGQREIVYHQTIPPMEEKVIGLRSKGGELEMILQRPGADGGLCTTTPERIKRCGWKYEAEGTIETF